MRGLLVATRDKPCTLSMAALQAGEVIKTMVTHAMSVCQAEQKPEGGCA